MISIYTWWRFKLRPHASHLGCCILRNRAWKVTNGEVTHRTIIAKSMSHGDLCSVISSLTLNGNFPVAFEGGVASSSIRGGFAEKITSYWIPDAGDGLAMFRERGILTTSNRESVRKAGASVGSVRGECKRSVRGVGFRRRYDTVSFMRTVYRGVDRY